MKLIVLGMGCPRCAKLAASAKEAATSLGLDFTLEEITDKAVIAQYGGPALPALVVDGAVVSAGEVLEADAVKPLLSNPSASADAIKAEQAKEAASYRNRRMVAFLALVVLVLLAIYAAFGDAKPASGVPAASGKACSQQAGTCADKAPVVTSTTEKSAPAPKAAPAPAPAVKAAPAAK